MKYPAISPLLGNSIMLIISSFIMSGTGFLFWIIAANYYNEESVGLVVAASSAISLVTLLSRLGFDQLLIRKHANIQTRRNDLIITCSSFMNITTIIFMSVVLILYSTLPGWNQNLFWIISVLLFSICASISSISNNLLMAEGRGRTLIIQNSISAFRLLIIIPLASFGSYGLLMAQGVGYITLIIIPFILYGIKILGGRIEKSIVQENYQYIGSTYISSIFSIGPTYILPTAIFALLGPSNLAHFYMAFTIGSAIQLIPSSITTSLFVEGSKGEPIRHTMVKSLKFGLSLIATIVLIVALFGSNILQLFGETYRADSDLLLLFTISAIPSLFVQGAAALMKIRNRNRALLTMCVAQFSSTMGLFFLFTQWFGLIGVGYAWLVGNLCGLIVASWALKGPEKISKGTTINA